MESWTVSAMKLDSCWNSDWARSQRMLLSRPPLAREAGVSSWITPFSTAATCRASVSEASEDRK